MWVLHPFRLRLWADDEADRPIWMHASPFAFAKWLHLRDRLFADREPFGSNKRLKMFVQAKKISNIPHEPSCKKFRIFA